MDIEKILEQDSKTLATVIIANRVLGSFREEAKKCMIALMKRRQDGDKFEFEKFIEDGVSEYKIEINMNMFDDFKKQMTNYIIKDIAKL